MEWVIFGLLFGLIGITTYGVFANVDRRGHTSSEAA